MKQEKKNIKVLEISSLLDYKSNAVNHGFTNHGRKENLILSFKRKPIAISIHQDRATSFILNDSIFIFYLKKITPLLFIICTLCYSPTFAQKAKKGKSTPTTLNRKNAVLIGPNTNIDSLRKAQIDSVGKKFVKEVPDSLKQSSDIKSTVVYSARDSTIMDTEKQVVYLYGDAKVDYGDIALTADYIQLNWKTNEVFAKGRRDSTKSKNIGMPVFKQGAESYNSDSIRYNFKSRKAIIKALVTQQGEGYVQGKSVKKDDEDNLYIRNAIYTTCNLKHPHFNIYASKLKIIGKKQIVSGPFNLEINDIPLPIGLPFGFFPYQQKKENGTSGILIGQYGEEPAQTGRGFYLRDFGYYLAVNEHIGVQFRSEIYTKGSWGLGANGQYNKKYRYSGSFSLAYNKNVRGDEINPIVSNDFKIQWSHSPISYGKTQFSASVNVATNSYNQYNNLQNPAAYISNTLGSSMSYSVTFSPQFRFGSSFRIDQNTSTRVLNTGLDLNFGMAQFQPFKNKKAVQEKFWDGFRFGLDLNTSISLTNQKSQFSSPYDFTITNVLPRDSVLKQQEELRRLGRISNTDVCRFMSLLHRAKI